MQRWVPHPHHVMRVCRWLRLQKFLHSWRGRVRVCVWLVPCSGTEPQGATGLRQREGGCARGPWSSTARRHHLRHRRRPHHCLPRGAAPGIVRPHSPPRRRCCGRLRGRGAAGVAARAWQPDGRHRRPGSPDLPPHPRRCPGGPTGRQRKAEGRRGAAGVGGAAPAAAREGAHERAGGQPRWAATPATAFPRPHPQHPQPWPAVAGDASPPPAAKLAACAPPRCISSSGGAGYRVGMTLRWVMRRFVFRHANTYVFRYCWTKVYTITHTHTHTHMDLQARDLYAIPPSSWNRAGSSPAHRPGL